MPGEQSFTAGPESHKNLSRVRPRACDSCWQRKIRCDNGGGRCRNCQIYGVQCTTTRANGSVIVRNPSESAGNTIPISRPAAKRQRKASETARPSPQQSVKRLSPSGGVRNAAASNVSSRQTNSANETLSDHNRDKTNRPKTNRSKTDDVLEGALTIENTGVPQKSKYAGRNSTQMMAVSAEDMFQDSEIRINVMKFYCPLMSFAEEVITTPCLLSPLIDKTVATLYVDAFFKSVHPIFPFLVEKAFRASVDEFYDRGQSSDAPTVACVYLVLALGSRATDTGSNDSLHFNAAWGLYDRIMASPYLISIQALILLTLELMSRNKEGQAIFAIGNAIRIAQSLGLHRALSSHKHAQEQNFVARHYQLRQCVWWVCYCLDKKLCFEGGRPSIINDHDCDVDPITLEEDAEESSPLWAQKESAFFYFPHLVGFCRIMSDTMVLLFSKNLEPCGEAAHLQQVESIDATLLQWRSELPPQLQFDSELAGNPGRSSTECSLLHCMYYNSLLTIHKAALFDAHSPEVKAHANPRIASADLVCWNAARALARTVNDMMHMQSNSPVPAWTATYILTAVFTLYTGIMRNPQNWTCDSDVVLMKSMARSFARSHPNPIAISSFNDLLSSLCSAIDVARKPKDGGNSAMRRHADDANNNAHSHQADESNSTTFGGSEDQLDMNPDFHFEDFYGLRGEGELGYATQLWPVDLNFFDAGQFNTFESSQAP